MAFKVIGYGSALGYFDINSRAGVGVPYDLGDIYVRDPTGLENDSKLQYIVSLYKRSLSMRKKQCSYQCVKEWDSKT